MKKNSIAILLLLLTLCSCGNNDDSNNIYIEPETHTHTYSNDWSSDSTNHWNQATCQHSSEKTNISAHTYGEWTVISNPTASKEGLKVRQCSVCNYKQEEVIAKAEPIYAWQYADVLQDNIIVSYEADSVTDYDGTTRPYVELVDRAIDSTADEIIKRLEYVYGEETHVEEYSTLDPVTGEPFVTFKSNDSFASIPSKKYTGYDAEGNTAAIYSYILTDIDGNYVQYDSSIHPTYVNVDGTKYAAINSLSNNGNFTSALNFRYYLGGTNNSLTYSSTSTELNSILNFTNAITGSGTWEYSERQISTTRYYYDFNYNTETLTTAWNWAGDYSTTAKIKLKQYIAYIAYNNITDYDNLPSESAILFSNYTSMISDLDCINFADTYYDVLYQVIANRIIGDAYVGDKKAGTTATAIAQAIYKTSTKVISSDSTIYYENGVYKQLYNSTLASTYMSTINTYNNSNYTIANYLNARNYKAYDVVITGILNEIKNNALYNPISHNNYEIGELNNTSNEHGVMSTNYNKTEIYLYSTTDIDLNEYRLQFESSNVCIESIEDNLGNVLSYENIENEGIKIDYNLKYSTTAITTEFKNKNYIKITLNGSGDYKLYLNKNCITNA